MPTPEPLDQAVLAAIQQEVLAAFKRVSRVTDRTDAMVKAIAADLKGVNAKADETAQQVGKVAKTTDTHAVHIEDLSDAFATLVARKKADSPPVPRVCWLLQPPPDVAAAVMDDLLRWLGEVYVRYRKLPACWAAHPDVIEELLALRHGHFDACVKSTGTAKDEMDWHGTYLPAVAGRIRDQTGCGRDGHQDAPEVPPVPMQRYAVRAAAVWTAEKRSPVFTAAETTEAKQYREWPGGVGVSVPDTVPDDLD